MYPLFDEIMLMPDDDLRDLYFEMLRFFVKSDFDASSYFLSVFEFILDEMGKRWARSISVSNWDLFYGEYNEFITV